MENSDRRDRMERTADFQALLTAGLGLSDTNTDSRQQRFYDYLLDETFKQTGLQAVAEALAQNIDRMHGRATLPLTVFNYGRMFQEVYARICIEHDRDTNAPHHPKQSDTSEFTEDDLQFFSDIERTLSEWILEGSDSESSIDFRTSYSHVAGVAAFENDYRLNGIGKQIEDFGGSLIIQAWTLFESLSEDLWEAAVNSHPTVLGELRGKGGKVDPQVSFKEIQKHGFNVRAQMGTILKGKVAFTSLKAIREAYSLAFSDQSTSIDSILNDPWLQYASAIRNVLIHQRGIVDEPCRKQIAGVPNAPKITIGQKFPLTGTVCAELCDACRSRSTWLVNAVHGWLIGHPEKFSGDGDDREW
jgi:hypothetical protein